MANNQIIDIYKARKSILIKIEVIHQNISFFYHSFGHLQDSYLIIIIYNSNTIMHNLAEDYLDQLNQIS